MRNKVKNISYILLSVLVAIVLFFYATTTNYKNSLAVKTQSTATETYTHTITNVPVTIEYDSETYFISGFSPTINVDLIGSNRVILQKETDEATRSFQVTVDLTGLSVGTQSVDLQISGLPSGVNAILNPSVFDVKIGKRVRKNFGIVGKITNSQIAEGYSVARITLGLETVRVTSDEDTLAMIDHVEAIVPDASKLSENYTGTATLQAVDANGRILPVVL
ncbi:CdaR family protein [Streptococcus sp. X13SY08]|uniref:CdaR family protein n=1 Tax=Streptococcus sp. X13SY08 TaxID=1676616 RepID=UPI00066FBA08|nr:CdaR family protein [Streptococcus sp. X13SY08]